MSHSLDQLALESTYLQLPESLYTRLDPTPVDTPSLLSFNDALGTNLGIDRQAINDQDLAEVFAGNRVLANSQPLAAAYAGHQFGNWAGTLGDGRAILLGDLKAQDGGRYEIQLKGAGRTPYSRGGDGRAWLGPVIREYLISNVMPLYSVPSTLALAAVATGEHVLRENGPLPGAVLTRVAKSFVRVGTFEYMAATRDFEAMTAVVDHMIEHHYPDIADADNRALAFLNAVIERQADLIARWQSLGFIHGVTFFWAIKVSTVSVVGETIDYGPCAFMDEFNAAKVFSSIDRQGRYAYQNQPRIGHWNMAMLAQAILPILDTDEEQATKLAQAAVDRFPSLYATRYTTRMAEKIGYTNLDAATTMPMVERLLDLMQQDEVDFTNGFRALSQEDPEKFLALFRSNEAITQWHTDWKSSLSDGPDTQAMQAINPSIIPRNHQIEACIEAAVRNDWSLFTDLESALKTPFTENPRFAQAPIPSERVTATFCGT